VNGRPITETDTAQVRAAITNSLDKSIFATSNPDSTGRQVLVGEEVTYRITATLGEGSQRITLTDALPTGLDFLGSSVVSLGNVTGSALGVGASGSFAAGVVTFALGDIVNPADNVTNAGDIVVLEVRARVNDSTPQGEQLRNTATFTAATPANPFGLPPGTVMQALDDTESVVVLKPVLLIDKSVPVESGNAGTVVTYTVVVRHDASSAAPAYALNVTDPLLADLILVPGSATTTRGTITEGTNSVTLALDRLLLGESVTITYQATLANTVTNQQVLENTASLNYTTNPTGGPTRTATDTATVNVALFNQLAKEVFETSLAETPGTLVTPGEIITWRITATLDQGTQDLTVTEDSLPAGTVYVGSRVVSIGGQISGSALEVDDEGELRPGNVVRFAFGTLVNAADNINDARDQIVVEVRARVDAASPGNVDGALLSNIARLTSAQQPTPVVAEAQTNVVVPVLDIAKDTAFTTGDAGDVATYTVRISHAAASTAAAFGVRIEDPLRPGLVLVPGSATASAGTVVEGANSVGVSLPVLALGDTITITYRARLADDVVQGQSITNIATLNYATAPTDGRDFTDDDPATIGVVLPPATLAKEVAGTSLPQTTGTSVALGETVTWRMTATLAEGGQRLMLTDPIPLGMEYVSSSVVSLGNVTGSALGVGAAGVLSPGGDLVTFNFGDVVNRPDNISNAGDTIVVEVVGRVRDLPGNTDGRVFDNIAALNVRTPSNPYGVPPGVQTQTDATDDARVTLRLPELAIDKSTPFTSGDAGAVATYSVTLRHTDASAAPAFVVRIADLLAPGLVLVPGTAAASSGTISETGGAIGFTLDRLDLGQTVTITYQARLADDVVQAQSITNTARLDYTTAPDNGRPLEGSDPATITVSLPPATLAKSLFSTTLPGTSGNQLAIGEEAVFRLTATLAEGAQRLVLTDLLPAELLPVSSAVVSLGNVRNSALAVGAEGTITGQTVTFNFGDVINPGDNISDAGDIIVVEVRARLLDTAGVVTGAPFTNTASLQPSTPDNPFGVPPGVPTQPPATGQETVTAALPVLTVDKSTPFTTGDAGDVATYTVVLRHDGASAADAYNVSLTDPLAPGIVLVPGSATATAGTVSETAGAIILNLAQLSRGDTVTITYQARLLDNVVQGQSITNTAALAYTTAPTDGRDLDAQDDATINVALAPATLDKTLVATSLPSTTGSELAIGEEATFRLTATLGEGAQRLVLTDLLPGALLPISSRVVSLGNVTGSVLGVGAAGTVSGQTVTFNFGDVVNPGDNISNAGDVIVVEITARLLDVPGAVTGATFTNAGSLQPSTPDNPYGVPPGVPTQPPATDNETVTSVLPLLAVDKSTPFTTGDAGDVATYTVVLRHDGASAADAYNLSLTDPLAAGIVLVPGSATATAGTVSEAAGAITLTLAQLVRGDSVTITYQARLLDSVVQGQSITNTAALAYSTAPTDGRPLVAQDDANISVLLSNALTKTLFATDNPDTPADQVARGETVTWRLTATLAEGTQRLLLIDDLPVGYTLVDSRVFSLGGTSGASLAVGDAGTPAGQRISFDFGVVTNPAGSGAQPVIVELRARLDESAPDNPAPNTTRLTASTPGGTNTTTNEADNDPVVVQPVLDLAKADAGGFVRPGERVNYTLTVTHAAASTAPGYDLVVADALAASPWLRLVAGSVTTSSGSVVTGNDTGDVQVSVNIPRLLLGETVTISFAADVLATAPPAQLLPNTATLGYDSFPGPGGRPGTNEAGQNVPVNPTLSKQLITSDIVATTDPTDLTQLNPALRDLQPGEQVTYRILVTLPPGANAGLVLRDDLGAGALTLISSRVVAIGDGLSGSALAVGSAGTPGGGGVVFDFGTVTGATSGARQIEVEVIGRVRADATTGAAALTQGATLDYTIRGEPGSENANVSSDVLRPALAIAKATSTPGPVDGNDSVNYTLTVTNTSGAAAFDVLIGDDFLLGGQRAGGSVTITVDGAPAAGASIISGSTVNDPAVRVSLPRLDPGSVAVVAFSAITSANTLNGSTVDNRGDVAVTSAPGSNPDEFTGNTQSNIVSIPTLRPTLEKAVFSVDAPGVGSGQFDPGLPDAPVGATITYRLTINLQEGDTNLVLRDALPTGFAFIDSQVLAYGAKLSGGVAVGTPGSFSGGTVTFNIGTVTSLADNLPQTPDDAITVDGAPAAGASTRTARLRARRAGDQYLHAHRHRAGCRAGGGSRHLHRRDRRARARHHQDGRRRVRGAGPAGALHGDTRTHAGLDRARL
jgi:large repetitive protein